MKPKHQRRCGRKPVDTLGSARAMNEHLRKILKERGQSLPTAREEISAQFRRSKHFQGGQS